MDAELTPEQMQKALRLCDVLSLEDLTVATVILEQSGWDLQKTLSSMDGPVIPPPQPPQQQERVSTFEDEDPYNYQDYEPEEYNYNEYEYIVQKEEDLLNKKKMFDNQYVSIPLSKTTSEVPNTLEKRLSYDRVLEGDFSVHRHEYQNNLLKNSQKLCDRILSTKSQEVQKFYQNKKKIENNKKFLCYLYKRYKTKINFTFGTFILNLSRSYLDKKYLLVYIHKSEFEENKSIQMLLQQPEIANFINKHCITYGMFDSSDDYEIIQKYVPMRLLPAFALFKFDKKNQKQEYMSEYSILNKEKIDLIQWLAGEIGIQIKKKQVMESENKQQQPEEKTFSNTITQIVNEQNQEYEQMEKLYQLRRQQSKIKKQEIAKFEEKLEVIKQNFKEMTEYGQGEAIQMKFRLPFSGKSIIYSFAKKDKISKMFDYIHCFGRSQFEDQYSDFDLTQTFPRLSLEDKKQCEIGAVFQESERQNIIVKEI